MIMSEGIQEGKGFGQVRDAEVSTKSGGAVSNAWTE